MVIFVIRQKCQHNIMKFIFLYISILFFSLIPFSKAQILYSESFNGLSLNTATYSVNGATKTFGYNDVPSTMFTINDGNLIADTTSGNYPFHANGQKQKAWLAYQEANQTDTFAVSTSWLNPIGNAAAWLITPTISNIAANTVLTWESVSPDTANADGYEVYVSTVTSSTPTVNDFQVLIFSTLTEPSTWQKHGLSLGAFAGQSIRIAFKNMSSNKYQLWLDDIKIENITNAYDASAVAHHIYKYSTINTNNVITATFKNNAYTPISNLDINYQLNNGTIITETKILSPALNYLESRVLTFSMPFNSSTAAYNDFKIWTGNINAQADQNHTNDTITGNITLATSTPVKNILVEPVIGARDAWSPDTYLKLKNIASTDSNVIIAAHHQQDNMSSFSSSALITDFSADYNQTLIDRYYFPSQYKALISSTEASTLIAQRFAMKVPATVTLTNITYDTITRQINATVSTTFYADVKGNYLLNLYVKENNVYGPMADSSDNGWNQYNAFYNIPASVYYQYGNYDSGSDEYIMSAASYKHQYVIDTMLSTTYGATAGIPVSGSTIGQTYTLSYTYTLPIASMGEFRYNADNIYLIGTLSEYGTNITDKTILNCAEVKLTSKPETMVGLSEYTLHNVGTKLYPNPTSNACFVQFTLQTDELISFEIYNTLGELISIESQFYSAGNVKHPLSIEHLPTGNYYVRMILKNQKLTKKLIVIK